MNPAATFKGPNPLAKLRVMPINPSARESSIGTAWRVTRRARLLDYIRGGKHMPA